MKRFVQLISILVLLGCGERVAAEKVQNLVTNPGFILDDAGTLKGWVVDKSAEVAVDSQVKYGGNSTLCITRSSEKGASGVSQLVTGLEPDTDYLFSCRIKTKEDFGVGRKEKVGLRMGGVYRIWLDNPPKARWYPLNARLHTLAGAKEVKVKVTVQGTGPVWIAEPNFCQLETPKSGIDLSDKYLKVPFGTFAEGEIHDHLNVQGGTIEFWVKPKWEEEAGGRGFKDEDMHSFFFWGRASNVNSLFIYNLNKFPNLYFHITNLEHKYDSSFLYHNTPSSGWKKNWWHHVAAVWKVTGDGIEMDLLVDGASVGKNKLAGTLDSKTPHDMLIGIGKRIKTIDATRVAKAEIAMFRISNRVRYTEPFIPNASYAVDEYTTCFLPLSGDKDLKGFFHLPGKQGILEAAIIYCPN